MNTWLKASNIFYFAARWTCWYFDNVSCDFLYFVSKIATFMLNNRCLHNL